MIFWSDKNNIEDNVWQTQIFWALFFGRCPTQSLTMVYKKTIDESLTMVYKKTIDDLLTSFYQ